MQALSFQNTELNITEPFNGLFTQGMVCHETYKDEDGNWLNPEEIIKLDDKIVLRKDESKTVKIGPSSLCLNQKNTIDPEKIIVNTVLMLSDYLYYLIVLLKKMSNGLSKV